MAHEISPKLQQSIAAIRTRTMSWKVQDYLNQIPEALLAAPLPEALDREAPVALVSYDSREVVPGTLFFCKGAHFKREFLDQAVRQGAIAYISEKPWDVDLPGILVKDLRPVLAPLADLFYGHPSGALHVIGLTGTKGKSSTAYYLKSILDVHLAGRSESGIISSIDTYDGVERFESHITTPEPLELQKHFANARGAGLEYLTMEVSSQALKYHRSLCTQFAAACFLNIGYDHISPIEHPDFEDYFASKLRIFAQTPVACVNLDCDHADRILEAARQSQRTITFSQKNPAAQVFGGAVRKRGEDILFTVKTPRFQRELRLTMPGLFNVENALAAVAVCEGLNIPESAVYLGLMRARVPGRMEVYSNADSSITAIVDYAHNRMSFETLFQSTQREYPGRRIVSLFGCPGKKALDRRKDLGEIAGKYAELVVVTEEDSGEEDTLSICNEIAGHVRETGCACLVEPNRGEAIRKAVFSCEGQPSVLLLTGKGAETRQKRGTEYIDVPSDVEYAKTFLQEYDVLHGLDGLSQVRGLLALLPQLGKLAGTTVVICAQDPELAGDLEALRTLGVRVVRTGLEHAAAGVREFGAKRLLVLAERGGVWLDPANEKTRLDYMDARLAQEVLESGLLDEVTQKNLRICLEALEAGAEECALLPAREEHALLLELLCRHGHGTAVGR